MFERGNITLARWRGVPIRVNWTALLGAAMFSGFRFVPGFWLGFFVLIVVHELGHAFLVLRRHLRPVEVMVHGFGGHCSHERGSPYDHAIIAWGGVLAQLLVLFVPAVLFQTLAPKLATSSFFVIEFLEALVRTNLILVAFNLIPFPPLDGAQAWKLPKMWRQRRRKPKKRKPATKHAHLRAVGPRRQESPDEAARRIAREALDDARTKH